jgi:hypothetical protein
MGENSTVITKDKAFTKTVTMTPIFGVHVNYESKIPQWDFLNEYCPYSSILGGNLGLFSIFWHKQILPSDRKKKKQQQNKIVSFSSPNTDTLLVPHFYTHSP